MSITSEAKKEVERLLHQHQRLKAIKYLCDAFGVSLAESKVLVEAVEKEIEAGRKNISSFTRPASSGALSGALQEEVIQLLQANKKIEAVKHVKAALDTSLKHALQLVEKVDKETNPNYRSVKVNTGCVKGIAIFFAILGFIFLGVAGIIYYFQEETISKSETTFGVVVDFRNDNGATAPVILYKWKNEEKYYYSSTYSNPPSYEIDEKVTLFVNREDPEDVVVNTFSDRWFGIIIFGGLGTFFMLFIGLYRFISRKF